MRNIKVTELRLGNYVMVNGEIKTVLQLQLKPEIIHVNSHLCNFATTVVKECQGITITDEILVVFGFVKDGYDYWTAHGYKSYFELAQSDNGKWYQSINYHEYDNGEGIDYVHELQNLFYSIKGEELRRKDEKYNQSKD